MIQKIMKCGLIGGFILFVWGAVSWTVLPWQKSQVKSFSDESNVRSAIRNNIDGSGIYMLPSFNHCQGKPDEIASAKERMREGPFATITVMANGKNPSMVGGAVWSLIVKVIAACLVTWLLLHSAHPHEYNKSVKFITMIGIVIAIAATLPYAIWFGFPGSFAITSMLEIVIGWFLASLAIARILSGKAKI
jgi:hypothetical protein